MSCETQTEIARQTCAGHGAVFPCTPSSPLQGLIEAARQGVPVTYEQVTETPGCETLSFSDILALGNPGNEEGFTLAHFLAGKGRRFSVDELQALGNPHLKISLALTPAHLMVLDGHRFAAEEIAALGNPDGGDYLSLAECQLDRGYIFSAREIRTMGNPLCKHNRWLSDLVREKNDRPWSYPELLELGLPIPRTEDGLPILYREEINGSRFRWIKKGSSRRHFQYVYRVTCVQTEEGPEDVDAIIEIEDVDDYWQPIYRRLSASKAASCDTEVQKVAFQKVFQLRYHADPRPPLTVQGQAIPAPLQGLARAIVPYATLGEYLQALRADFPADYSPQANALLPEQKAFQMRGKALLAVLPRLGFSPREVAEIADWLKKTKIQKVRHVIAAPIGHYLKHAKEDAWSLLEFVAYHLDHDTQVDDLVGHLPFPAQFFERSGGQTRVIIDPPDDLGSHAAVAARLARGESVPFEILLQYPDLVARFGV